MRWSAIAIPTSGAHSAHRYHGHARSWWCRRTGTSMPRRLRRCRIHARSTTSSAFRRPCSMCSTRRRASPNWPRKSPIWRIRISSARISMSGVWTTAPGRCWCMPFPMPTSRWRSCRSMRRSRPNFIWNWAPGSRRCVKAACWCWAAATSCTTCARWTGSSRTPVSTGTGASIRIPASCWPSARPRRYR